MNFASVTLEKGNLTLRGYLLDDGTYQFCFKGKCMSFPDMLTAWSYWTSIN